MIHECLWVLIVMVVLFVNGCRKPPSLEIVGLTSVELNADSSIGSITFITDRDWSASSSDRWVTVSPSSGSACDRQVTINVHCDANRSYIDRSATVTIRVEELSKTITVIQAGFMPEPVDLGLSVKWASANMGAFAPEEYGGYYVWGDVVPESENSWGRYKWANGAVSKLTKYCPAESVYASWYGEGTPDGKTMLDPEDDAAHVVLGGKWRMPTVEEQDELVAKCTWIWTIRNGINGYEVQSTEQGNTNSIFLPAAGGRFGGGMFRYVGSRGFYWSSSLAYSPANACCLGFYSEGVSTGGQERILGFMVRPITE